jgi:hypothetical protein
MEERLKSLLFDFERRAFSNTYAEYYAVKRNNFFATIQAFPDVWQCFMALDEIWKQEFASRIPGATEEFERAFNKDKRKKFAQLGLGELHKWWQRYSELGHVSGSALGGGRICLDVSPGKIQFQVKYFETDKTVLSLALMDLLQASYTLERSFFDCFRDRRISDPSLASKREAFAESAEQARMAHIDRYRRVRHNGRSAWTFDSKRFKHFDQPDIRLITTSRSSIVLASLRPICSMSDNY